MWDIAPSNGQKAHCKQRFSFSICVFWRSRSHLSYTGCIFREIKSYKHGKIKSLCAKATAYCYPNENTRSIIQHLCRTEFTPISLPLHLISADPFEMLHGGLLSPDGGSHVLIRHVSKSEGGPEPLISRAWDKNKSPLFPKSGKWSMFTMSSLQVLWLRWLWKISLLIAMHCFSSRAQWLVSMIIVLFRRRARWPRWRMRFR